MSKLARKPIDTSNVTVSYADSVLKISGKHGELQQNIHSSVELEIGDNSITVKCENKAFLGLHCALIINMVKGVNELFTETLILKGVGYRVALSNNQLNFNLGYSHPVVYTVDSNVNAEIVSPTEIKLSGPDKQLVGQVAAQIIQLRPAKKDPYKQKGIQRTRDRIIKKVGKKVK